jgi:hypothetical protein
MANERSVKLILSMLILSMLILKTRLKTLLIQAMNQMITLRSLFYFTKYTNLISINL